MRDFIVTINGSRITAPAGTARVAAQKALRYFLKERPKAGKVARAGLELHIFVEA